MNNEFELNSLQKVKEGFINNLTSRLNRENNLMGNDKEPLDVCFMISAIDQQLGLYKDFLKDLSNGYTFNGYEADDFGYSNSEIKVFIQKSDVTQDTLWNEKYKQDYYYIIKFTREERYEGYCMCAENDDEYNKEHDCCGISCDWDAPSFEIIKVQTICNNTWDGLQKDYWRYEKEFKLKEENKNINIDDTIKEKRKQEIMEQINLLNQELISL